MRLKYPLSPNQNCNTNKMLTLDGKQGERSLYTHLTPMFTYTMCKGPKLDA